ncbi:uncharacterized protein [Triticum aestivum]|uniref:uncharacterized protein isoform X5 n=1 Tax=Triticum aestivum TaxID=4565 RepID=UPI001D0357EF|nr:uncharacterized protein LOC123167666 isoform X5 [Triticum aestivum]XP_044441441.1 uncharacterized protein LOC123167666 isoform X5 [Triticum aestivum]
MGLCKFIVSHILYVAVFCLAEVVRSRSSERPMQGGPRSEMALLSKCRTISHSPSMMIFWAALLAPHKLFRKLLGSFLQMKMFIQKKIFICAPGHFCKLCSPSAEQFLSEHPSLVRQVKAYLVVCRQRDCTPLLLGHRFQWPSNCFQLERDLLQPPICDVVPPKAMLLTMTSGDMYIEHVLIH